MTSARKAFIGHVDPLRFHQKHILIRVDYNVPLKVPRKEITETKVEVASDARIIDSLPTLKFFLASEAKIVLCSHLGRPKNGMDSQLSLRPVADYLKRLLGDINVEFLPDCIGSEVKQTICNQPPGSIILLENLRFHQEEIMNDEGFAKELADGMDVYVNEAFSVCHRENASVCAITKFFRQKFIGFSLNKELTYLSAVVEAPRRPVGIIIGGVKVSSKVKLLRFLAEQVDKIFIGGAMVFTFYKAAGFEVGDCDVEEEALQNACEILDIGLKRGNLYLALDARTVPSNISFEDAKQDISTVDCIQIPPGRKAYDIGRKTITCFLSELESCNTIFFNGPLGMAEDPTFANGTTEILNYMCKRTSGGAITVVAGGDTVAAAHSVGALNLSHISMGGGASLMLLSGKALPGIAAIPDEI